MNPVYLLTPDPRWFHAPRERTPQFFRTYAQVSIALQQTLRQLAPALFFADPGNLENHPASCVMLAYAASRPFRPASRTELTYDVTNAAAMRTFFRFSRPKLLEGLTLARARLLAAGQDDLAQLYDAPRVTNLLRALKRKRLRKPLRRLLQAEGKLLNALTGFSGFDQCSPKEQRKQTALIVKRWQSTLQHSFLAIDLSSLAAPLLDAATSAYLLVSEPLPSHELIRPAR